MTTNNTLTSTFPCLKSLPMMFSYLNHQSTRALSNTCRHFYLLTQNDLIQLKLFTDHFPLFKPSQYINGALTISASQYYQRLHTAHSIGLRAFPLKNFKKSDNVKDLKFTSDGTKAFLIGKYGMLELLDFKTAKVRTILAGNSSNKHSCLQITLDQKRALLESRDNTLKFWNLETGQCLQTLIGHTSRVTCLQITSDGTRVLSASFDKTLKFWNLETGQCLWTITKHNTEHFAEGHTHFFFTSISCMQITPDGRRALLSGNIAETMLCSLQLWDLETGQCLQTLFEHEDHLNHLQITPDGTKAISAYSSFFKIWDLKSDKCLEIFTETLHIDFLQITPDGTKAFTGSNRDREIDFMQSYAFLNLWDLETGQCLWSQRKCDDIKCLEITPDGTKGLWAETGNWQSTIELLDLKTGECLETFPPRSIECLQISPDGTSVLLGCSNNGLELWTFYALLEERITMAARSCISDIDAKEAITSLPQFAQNDILAIRSNIIKKRIFSKAESYVFPGVGCIIKKCAGSLESIANCFNIYKVTDINAESLNIYIATHVALPIIRMCFLRAIQERNTILIVESIERVNNLPLPIKKVVYRKLYEIHLAKKVLPQIIPPDYGESSFLSEHGCSVEERIEAIARSIKDFKI